MLKLVVLPAAAQAEQAWIRDEVRVHKRTGPGTKYRILGTVKTGESYEVLSRGDGWTQIRGGGETAWIPAGYLQSETPARVQLEQFQAESAQMRAGHGKLTAEVEELRRRGDRGGKGALHKRAHYGRASYIKGRHI